MSCVILDTSNTDVFICSRVTPSQEFTETDPHFQSSNEFDETIQEIHAYIVCTATALVTS